MALGKPVIATDSGGSREIIVEGLTGFLVPPKDSNQLTNRIIELLDNPIQATEMGSRGKQRVFEVFSIETMVGQYVDLYNDLFTRRARK
jgi:glycosyltransferase involved in cell wall biosynthesis